MAEKFYTTKWKFLSIKEVQDLEKNFSIEELQNILNNLE